MFTISSFNPESRLDNFNLYLYQNGLTCQVQTNYGVNIIVSYDKDTSDVIDKNRLQIIAEMATISLLNQLGTHEDLAMSGAMRWYPNLRPEVMVNLEGRAI